VLDSTNRNSGDRALSTMRSGAAERRGPRRSLRLRLPLAIAALIVAVLAIFLWFAFREVEAALVRAGSTRAKAAADQLASLFERSNQQSFQQQLELAKDPDVQRCAQDGADACEAARARLARAPTAGPRRFGLWNAGGTRVLDVAVPSSVPDAVPKELPAPERPALLGASPLKALNDTTVYADVVVEVTAPSGPARAGLLVSRSSFVVNPPGVLNQLIGRDAVIELGNQAGGVWTDLSRIVPAPPIDLSAAGVSEYASASGDWRLGALTPIRGTPWAIWVEFRRATIVAPAQRFLVRMIALSLGFVAIVIVLVSMLSVRITRPLLEVSDAASQIAAGDYSKRVTTLRQDEIGVLGHAFNAMADDIQLAYGALKQNVDQTRFALAAAQMGIWEIDVAADRVRWSDTLAPVFGLTPDDAPRTTDAFFNLLYPDDRASAREAMTTATERRRTDYSTDFRVRWPDGSIHWLDSRARVLYDPNGGPMHMLGVVIDVTERRALETQLRQAQKLEAIGQLAGGVAHDFNNLLTAILGYASLASDSLDPQHPLRGHMEEIAMAGERGAGLTRQLLAFSRQQMLEPTLINLNTLVGDISQMLRRLIGEHIELVARLTPDLDVILADRTQIEQVIVNLAVNARDAMPAGGRLTIETANMELDDTYELDPLVIRPGRYVMLAVSDTGTGIDEDTRRRMFDPFFTTKERGKGTGLGLATVYGIIKQSGGYIWVYSEPGHGAAFKIYLPRAEAANAATARGDGFTGVLNGDETVLLVEDEAAVRFLSRTILERAGYRVVEAQNPSDAEAAFKDDVALLVSDVIMPGSSGPALFQSLVTRRPDLKVLYMSGYTDDMITRTGRLTANMAFLQKPFTAEVFLRKVREVLDA
jgi:PAS domain S-box-containing protein